VVQTGVWGLGILLVVAGGVYYLNFQMLAGAEEDSQDADAMIGTHQALHATLRGSASAGEESGGDLAALHSEVAAIRGLLERHDKMIKYIMTRFVEKGGVGTRLVTNGDKLDASAAAALSQAAAAGEIGIAVAEAKPAELEDPQRSSGDVNVTSRLEARSSRGKGRRGEDVFSGFDFGAPPAAGRQIPM
jgi:hypothetical protein